MTVIWYTAQFYALFFLQSALQAFNYPHFREG